MKSEIEKNITVGDLVVRHPQLRFPKSVELEAKMIRREA
jgi:hypothetical protein